MQVDDLLPPMPMQANSNPATVTVQCQIHPPTRTGRSMDKSRHWGINVAGAGESDPNLSGFPRGIRLVLPMLQGATAATAEVRAGGKLAFGRGSKQSSIRRPPLSAAGERLRHDDFARKSEGQIGLAAIGKQADPVAIGTDLTNGER